MVNKKSLRIEGVDYAFGVDVYPGGVTIWSDGEGGFIHAKDTSEAIAELNKWIENKEKRVKRDIVSLKKLAEFIGDWGIEKVQSIDSYHYHPQYEHPDQLEQEGK